MPMTYLEALAYLTQFTNYETLPPRAQAEGNLQLERVTHLLGQLGDPHLNRLTVHVAGTKGKGSVAAMTASVLSQAGYRTGLFTSPHLIDFRERIRIDGAPASDQHVAEAVAAVAQVAEAYHAEPSWGRLTTYELTVLTAFVCFQRAGSTAQVLEVGLGGRLDATNVVPAPEVCIITPISYDHMAILGNTLAAIAGEKAGIIKPGVPLVMAPQQPEAREVLASVCTERDALLIDVARDYRWQRLEHDLAGQWVSVSTPMGEWELHTPLLGGMQVDNLATVVAALEVLTQRGVPLAPEHVVQGLDDGRWPGRLQVVGSAPLIVLDGAHNGASARWLAAAVRYDLPHQRAIFVVGTQSDKDQEAIAAELASAAHAVITTRSDSPRATDPEVLAGFYRQRVTDVRVCEDVVDALAEARAAAGPEDVIIVTGSLYLVGEALGMLQGPDAAAFSTETARRAAAGASVFF